MTFCAPRAVDYGFIDHGCAVYGGIQMRSDVLHHCQRAITDIPAKDLYIPQFNLANHWRRRFMVPHSIGFPELLVKTSAWSSSGIWDRAPGNWPFDQRQNLYRNRNLLAGAIKDESAGDTVRLWVVNELSDRRTLLEFNVRLRENADASADEWELSEEVGDDVELHPGPVSCLKLPFPALELVSFPRNDASCQVLTRCEKAFYLCDTSSRSEPFPVMKSSVRSFCAIPYMDSEIAMLDGAGFLWHGEIGQTVQLSRVKCYADRVEMICPTDHPRIICLSDSDSLWLQDLREGRLPGKTLFSVPDYDDCSQAVLKRNFTGAFKKPKIRHVRSFPGIPRSVFVVTSKRFYLLDERMPGVHVFESAHTIFEGGDTVILGPTFEDPQVDGGRIFPVYLINNTVFADVQQLSLYLHPGRFYWSSLAPVRRILEPIAAAEFCKQQLKYGMHISSEQESTLFGNGPTRALHLQNGLQKDRNNNERHLLFRMMDDGSIWYETVRVIDDSELEDAAVKRSLDKMAAMIAVPEERRRPCWETGINPSTLVKPKYRCWNVEQDLGEARFRQDADSDTEFGALICEVENSYPEPEICEQVEDSERMISRLVVNLFNKQ